MTPIISRTNNRIQQLLDRTPQKAPVINAAWKYVAQGVKHKLTLKAQTRRLHMEAAVWAMVQTGGNQVQAAKLLGIHRNLLNRYLQAWIETHERMAARGA